MEYDNIKLLNLEEYDINVDSFRISKINNILYCHIALKRKVYPCPLWGGLESTIHDYRQNKITHSISTNNPCFILYQARRFQCKYCHEIFYETNPFSPTHHKTSYYTKMKEQELLKKASKNVIITHI